MHAHGSLECIYTQGLKCEGGELNHDGPTQGSSSYPQNDTIKFNSFPVSFHLHYGILGWCKSNYGFGPWILSHYN